MNSFRLNRNTRVLGAVHALYFIGETWLCISPLLWWTSNPPQTIKTAAVPCGEHRSKPFAVRLRGWFINDEAPSMARCRTQAVKVEFA